MVQAYIIRRLLLNLPVLLIIIAAVYSIVRINPGADIAELMLEEVRADKATKDAMYHQIRRDLGLDTAIHIQFGRFLWKLFQGDMGKSYYSGRPVVQELFSRLPPTLELGMIGMIVGAMLALPLGLLGAIYQDTWIDYFSRVSSVMFLSIPNFFIATVVILIPSILFHYSPPIAYQHPWEDLGANLRQVLPAALILASSLMGATARMTRSAMLEVIRQDYIRTARAKGLSERLVIYRHALKNAMIPVVTLFGLYLTILIAGTAILEVVFVIPGVGRLTVTSIQVHDFPQVQGNILFIATWILIANLLVDLFYAWLDPRIRYS